MKFWKRLRWVATALFIFILVASWFLSDGGTGQPSGTGTPARAAPAF